jgi:tetratricopeptide (TPR) repeat protein
VAAPVSTRPASVAAPAAPIPMEPPAASAAVAEEEPSDDEADLPEDVNDALEEVDFYLAQGMTDEARDVITDALGNHPGLPALVRKLAEIDGTGAEVAEDDVGRTSDPDHSFALAEKLAQDADMDRVAGSGGGDAPVDVKDVIAQFKAGVDKQVDKNDAATHYDLGIAYMEMGLHDEAISEFELCLTSAPHVCTAHTMIGLSFVAKGEWLASIEHFKSALAAPHAPADEVGLSFELGNAYEFLGKPKEAREYYAKVHAFDAGFRDVEVRLARVSEATTKAASGEGDDFDSLFDNMIMKD